MKNIALTSICIGLFAITSFAQVNGHRENQQDRIAQGVKSGQLTPGETSNLENQQRGLNGEIRADRAADGGKLTSAEKQQINGQQNGLSKQVSQDKHNGASDHFGNSEAGKREENQQDRIAQGIKSGKLSARQSSNLEGRDAGINREIKTDRKYNGGHLTNAEKKQVDRQQNHVSKTIYHDKRK
ncbi:MAG: hypothetical protein M3Y57_21485 [Acidobacteriota bacterium]|nr:hypothetical protein [Acidobacteriota bacterium]